MVGDVVGLERATEGVGRSDDDASVGRSDDDVSGRSDCGVVASDGRVLERARWSEMESEWGWESKTD